MVSQPNHPPLQVGQTGQNRRFGNTCTARRRRCPPGAVLDLLRFQIVFWLALLLLGGLVTACQMRGGEVTVIADGERHVVTVRQATAGEVLRRAGVTLGKLDRVSPDTWEMVRPGATVVVIRGREEFVEVEDDVPFPREIVRNEALPAGEQRLAQKGEPGKTRITYRVFYADDVETERTEVRRTVLKEPVDEIVVVGAQGGFASVPIAGAVAYISNGNAWIMRETSSSRRPLTSQGDLDGRVFDLSPDGRYLIFTRVGGSEPDTPLNSLWIVTTMVLGELPVPLGLENLLYGGWAPDGQRFAYSTAEHTGGRPGWKALNDLWLASFRTQEGVIQVHPARVEVRVRAGRTVTETQPSGLELGAILPPSSEGAFSWWGTNYAWAPNGKYIAYGRPDQIGIVDLALKLPIRFIEFPEYNTYSDWIWTPGLSWSPDSRFVVCTVHKPAGHGIADEDSPVFDVEVFAMDRSVHAGLVRDAGMWTGARWSPLVDGLDSFVAFGLARNPHESDRSRYDLYLMDRDGSNSRRLYPPTSEMGLVAPPQIAWSPTSRQMLLVHGGDLFLLEVSSGLAKQLTGDGGVTVLRWQG